VIGGVAVGFVAIGGVAIGGVAIGGVVRCSALLRPVPFDIPLCDRFIFIIILLDLI
jgi:hypothetical protein